MLKKTITYLDLDDNPVTEEFYFNLSKAEIAELELTTQGGLTEYLRKIVEAEDGRAIIDKFKELISMSIGQRSEDGKRFIKNQEITDNFVQSDAYSELFVELVTNAEAGAAFIKGVVPSAMAEAMDKAESAEVVELPQPTHEAVEAAKDVPPWIAEDRDPTDRELREMTPEQLQEAFRRKASRAQQ